MGAAEYSLEGLAASVGSACGNDGRQRNDRRLGLDGRRRHRRRHRLFGGRPRRRLVDRPELGRARVTRTVATRTARTKGIRELLIGTAPREITLGCDLGKMAREE